MKIFTAVTGAMVAIAITGAATALPGTGTVDSGDIINGEVKRADIAAGAVNSTKIGDGTVRLADLAADSVNSAKVAANSLTGADINESTLNLNDGQCSLENVHSFARVKGSASMPGTFTSSTAYVDIAHNCAGGAVQVRRLTTGFYYVKFVGDPALLANVGQVWNASSSMDNIVGTSIRDQDGAGTGFFVAVRNHDGASEDGWFTINTY